MDDCELLQPSSSCMTGLSSGKPRDPKLWKAAQDFQAVFLSQFVKAMRTSPAKGELFEESAGREIFDEMFSEAIAEKMAENGSLGLHQVIYRELGGTFIPPDVHTNQQKAEKYDAL